MRLKTKSIRGQAIVILALSLPMLLAFAILMLGGGILVRRELSLSSATDASALAAASQIDPSCYVNSAACAVPAVNTQIIAPGSEPNTDPCNTNHNQTLCVVLTTLCDSYNTSTSNQSACISSGSAPSSCPSANPPPQPIYVYNFQGPACLNSLNYWVLVENNQQTVQVQTWYTYPNPFGDVFTRQFSAGSTQTASLVAGAIPN